MDICRRRPFAGTCLFRFSPCAVPGPRGRDLTSTEETGRGHRVRTSCGSARSDRPFLVISDYYNAMKGFNRPGAACFPVAYIRIKKRILTCRMVFVMVMYFYWLGTMPIEKKAFRELKNVMIS